MGGGENSSCHAVIGRVMNNHMPNANEAVPEFIPAETSEPSGYLSWEMVNEANVFDDSEPDDGEVY
jgi:hypothetical protein